VLLPDAAGYGTDIDDVAGTLLAHDRKGRLHNVDDAIEVRTELLVEIGKREGLEVAENGGPSVIDHDVDFAEPRHSLADGPLGLTLVGDIQLHEGQTIAFGIRESHPQLVHAAAGGHHFVARVQRRRHDARADAAVGPGDKPYLAHVALVLSVNEAEYDDC
jgi:hypothetical protein